MKEITIKSEVISSTELYRALSRQAPVQENVKLELRGSSDTHKLRDLESAVVVALIGATGTAFAALVAGILNVIQENRLARARIVITGSSGSSLEIPANTPKERITDLVEIAKKLDQPNIVILED